MAAAPSGGRAAAQEVVPPASEIPIPPKPAADTTPRADTIQPPFGRAVGPRTADIGPQYEWNREEMFASGALTVADLLERVPGTTGFRSGWLASPKFVAMNGDLGRIRIFYDGVEIDNLDPKSAPLLDLTTIEIWTLEHVRIERGANELRVHLQSWTTESTDSFTRTDVFTGDENTNLYRGFFGKRYGSGVGIQAGAQQFSTRAARLGGGGDALSLMGRFGIAKRLWSLDAFAVRRSGSRTLQPTFSTSGGLSIPQYDGNHDLAYVRGALGNTSGGPWAQLIASYLRFADRSEPVTAADARARRLVADTTDTTTRQYQYLAAAGIARGPLRISVENRIRSVEGEIYNTPGGRFEIGNRIGIIGVFAESNQFAQATRAEVIGRLSPVSFLALAGAFTTSNPHDPDTLRPQLIVQPKWTAARIEAGVRLFNPWVIGGFITRDTAIIAGPVLFDTAYAPVAVGRRQGLYAGLRGKLIRDLNVDVVATRWDSAGFYQPREQARAEINLATRWLSRFPSGNFGLKTAFVYDYRGRVAFPTAGGNRTVPASGIMSGLLEIRILQGVVSYQVRNIASENYQIVPDFFMPRTINIYGIRWDFWN
ncbi:MAG: Plug domain-containing protein [Gemmatimonadaceae bacterium]